MLSVNRDGDWLSLDAALQQWRGVRGTLSDDHALVEAHLHELLHDHVTVTPIINAANAVPIAPLTDVWIFRFCFFD